MTDYAIFTDASANPKSRLGVGAFLMLPFESIDFGLERNHRNEFAKQIKFRKFENVSSTRLEIETSIWAIKYFDAIEEYSGKRFILFTDSQCVAGLQARRERLENNNFIARSSNKELNNAELYIEIYKLLDNLNFEIVKLKGHVKSSLLDAKHSIFSIVDREVRSYLKSWIEEIKPII